MGNLMKWHKFVLGFAFFIVFSNPSLSSPAKEELSAETLYYKLSYRGLLTSMIWADLADIKMTSLQHSDDEQKSQTFELFLTTKHYKKAELFHPVRYTYRSTIDRALQRTVLVEEQDTGNNQSYDVLWLDWQKKTTHLFAKCGTQSDCPTIEHLPYSLLVKEKNKQLSYKESGDPISATQVLDPLSILYFLRTLDFTERTEISLVVADDIRLYQIEKQAVELLSLKDKKIPATKFKLHSREKKDNYYFIWLSNDQDKVPLRLSMDAPLGKLEINLMQRHFFSEQ